MQTNDLEGLGDRLAHRVARLRGRKQPSWSALEIEPLPPIAGFGIPKRRLELIFTLGPLSNQYPPTAASAMFDELPELLRHAVDDGVLCERRRASVGDPRRADEMDDEGHVTLRLTVPLTIDL